MDEGACGRTESENRKCLEYGKYCGNGKYRRNEKYCKKRLDQP